MTTQTDLMISGLALDRGAWLINRLDVNYGTRRLEIDAEYEEKPFQLIFKDFHLLSWEIFEDGYDPGTVCLDVIGMDFDEQAERKSAVINTDVFELIVSYSELEIEKAW